MCQKNVSKNGSSHLHRGEVCQIDQDRTGRDNEVGPRGRDVFRKDSDLCVVAANRSPLYSIASIVDSNSEEPF